jgi:hypothetical protein
MRLQRMVWTISVCLLFAMRGSAQDASQQSPKHLPPPAAGKMEVPISDADESRDRLAREMAKKANAARQATLKSDADKLLKLAVELKDSVEKSNANVLSVDVMKKAEEIERLAKSVKEKMKGPG